MSLLFFSMLFSINSNKAFADAFANEALSKFDAIMAPRSLKMTATMVITREDKSSQTYEFGILQKGDNKSRVTFERPPAMRGQEILRSDNMNWIYLPEIKRATPISNRDTFQGGDFSNGDILRNNLSLDYIPELNPKCDPNLYCLELTAKGQESTYRYMSLWLQKSDFLPVQAEYFDNKRRLLRVASFKNPREFGKGFKRPTQIELVNALSQHRKSVLTIDKLELDAEIPDARFSKSDLGK